MRNQSNKRIAQVHHYNNFYVSRKLLVISSVKKIANKPKTMFPLPQSASKYHRFNTAQR